MSGLPQPQLHKDAKYIFLSDWVSRAGPQCRGVRSGAGPKLGECHRDPQHTFTRSVQLRYSLLHTDRQDGTITDRDSNDFLTDNYGMGVEGR